MATRRRGSEWTTTSLCYWGRCYIRLPASREEVWSCRCHWQVVVAEHCCCCWCPHCRRRWKPVRLAAGLAATWAAVTWPIAGLAWVCRPFGRAWSPVWKLKFTSICNLWQTKFDWLIAKPLSTEINQALLSIYTLLHFLTNLSSKSQSKICTDALSQHYHHNLSSAYHKNTTLTDSPVAWSISCLPHQPRPDWCNTSPRTSCLCPSWSGSGRSRSRTGG